MNYSPKVVPDALAYAQAIAPKRDVTHKSGNRHSCPHGPTMNIFLTAIIGFATCEDDLKAEASVRYCRDSNCETVYVLSVIILVSICKLFSDPTLKIWNIAR
jgi:hypothetical protein